MHAKTLLVVLALTWLVGCLPPAGPEQEPTGAITVPQASARIQDRRSDNGNSYLQSHQAHGQSFDARWELGNALKRTSKLQLSKMPVDWSLDQVKEAMQVVLDGRQANPWFRKIEPMIFQLIDEASDAKSRVFDIADQSPYRVAVKVQQRTKEWFVEVDVRIVDETGDNVGL